MALQELLVGQPCAANTGAGGIKGLHALFGMCALQMAGLTNFVGSKKASCLVFGHPQQGLHQRVATQSTTVSALAQLPLASASTTSLQPAWQSACLLTSSNDARFGSGIRMQLRPLSHLLLTRHCSVATASCLSWWQRSSSCGYVHAQKSTASCRAALAAARSQCQPRRSRLASTGLGALAATFCGAMSSGQALSCRMLHGQQCACLGAPLTP